MTVAVVTGTIRLDAGLSKLSSRYPEVLCAIRPLGFRWTVGCSGPTSSLERFRRELGRDATHSSFIVRSASTWLFAYAPRPAEMGFLRSFAVAGCLVLPPITLQRGLLRIRLLSASGRLPTLDRRSGPSIELVSRRSLTAERLREELEREWPDLPRLTPRQTEVVLAAVRAGYYDVPRRTDVQRIAVQLSLGRSTVEEHLRAAESSLVRYATGRLERSSPWEATEPPGEPIAHYYRYSSELELYVDLALRGERVTEVHLRDSPPVTGSRKSHPHLDRILEHIHTGRDDLRSIPVDLNVSPFERSVLEELRRIPPGKTRTYAEIARRLGQPGAARAVGNACAHNPAVVVIPCHRVVPARGGLGNYSATGGPRTKRRLLEREGAMAAARDPRVGSADGPEG